MDDRTITNQSIVIQCIAALQAEGRKTLTPRGFEQCAVFRLTDLLTEIRNKVDVEDKHYWTMCSLIKKLKPLGFIQKHTGIGNLWFARQVRFNVWLNTSAWKFSR